MFAYQSTAKTITVGPILDAAGLPYVTASIAAASFVKSVNGAAGVALHDTAAKVKDGDQGHYLVTLDATDTATIGELTIRLELAGYAMAPVTLEIGATVNDCYTAVSNLSITGSPAYQAAASFTKTNGTETLTYTATDTSNAVYHQIASDANGIDGYYEFTLAGDEVATGIVFKGRITNNTKSCVVQAYDWVGTAWATLFTLSGTSGTTDTSLSPALVAKYTGTGANIGKVRIRVYTALTSATLYVDQMLVGKTITNRSVGYSQGAIWVAETTNGGTAGTTTFINGTADHPCPWANALTLAGTLGINRFNVAPSTAITLGANLQNAAIAGKGYSLALGGYDLSYTSVDGCEYVTGTATASTHEMFFYECQFGSCTLGEVDIHRSHITGTITLGQGSALKPYLLHSCVGVGAAKVAFGSGAATTCVIGKWSGPLTVSGMLSGHTLYLDGDGDVTLTGTGGTAYVTGNIRLTSTGFSGTLHRSGTVTDSETDTLPDTAGTTTMLADYARRTGDYSTSASVAQLSVSLSSGTRSVVVAGDGEYTYSENPVVCAGTYNLDNLVVNDRPVFSHESNVSRIWHDSINWVLSSNVNYSVNGFYMTEDAALPAGAAWLPIGNATGDITTTSVSPAVPGDAMSLTTTERTTLAGVVWDTLTSALTTVGSIGKWILDYLDSKVSEAGGSLTEEQAALLANTLQSDDARLPTEGVIATVEDLSGITVDAPTTGEIAAAVWVNATRTLTGASNGVGPAATLNTSDIVGQVFRFGTRPLYARVTIDGDNATQAAISSIVYSVYELDGNDRTEVSGHVGVSVTVADVVYDTMQSDAIASTWNFKHTIDVKAHHAFPQAGVDYLVEYTLTPADGGQDVLVRFKLRCV